MKESVESTEDNRLKEEVVQIQKEEEECKDSCKKLREDSERKQPEIIPMNTEMKKTKKHSNDKKSKSRRTGTKSPNHDKTPIKTQ